jgi:hypothetical protein
MGVSNLPEMAVAHQPGLGRQVSRGDRLLHRATRVCGLCGGLGCQGACSSQYLLRQPERVPDRVSTIRQSRHRLAAIPSFARRADDRSRSPHWRLTDPGQPSREQRRQRDSAAGDNVGIPNAKPQFADDLPKEHQQAGGSPESGPSRAVASAAPLPRSRAVGRACAVVVYCPGVRSRYRASSRQ